jgi:hypothetical protein
MFFRLGRLISSSLLFGKKACLILQLLPVETFARQATINTMLLHDCINFILDGINLVSQFSF